MAVVQCLEDLREQLNAIAPNRDKTSDGGKGDTAHQERASSHNEDESGTPEWRDPDSKDEIRARDFDKDLREPGLTMGMVVAWLVAGAKSGEFWWLRYIIFDGSIWHKNSGWVRRDYNGSNPHDQHAHVNSDFSQSADEKKNCNYRLEDIPVALTNEDKEWIEERINAVPSRVWGFKLLRPNGKDGAGNTHTEAGVYQRYLDVVALNTSQRVIDALKPLINKLLPKS